MLRLKLKYKKNLTASKGFSLVELAISLFIISLIIVASLAGRDLLRASEVKILISESGEFKSSLNQFSEIHGNLPGDIDNATEYWPTANNGNADGEISTMSESVNATSQLALAGLINGTYTGVFGVEGYEIGSGGNTLESKTGANGIRVFCCSDSDGTRDIDFNNFINIFSVSTLDVIRRAGVVSPIEAFTIDKKIDDGFPDSGFVGAQGNWDGISDYLEDECYSDTGLADKGRYLSDDDDVKDLDSKCQLFFAYDW